MNAPTKQKVALAQNFCEPPASRTIASDHLYFGAVNGREAYAFLTLYNVFSRIDPGVLTPLIKPLRGVLKRMLCDTGIRAYGFDRKIKVELDIPVNGKSTLSDISYALARYETVSLKFREGSSLIDGEYLPLCLTLRPGSWVLTATLDSKQSESLDIPLDQVESSVVVRPERSFDMAF